MDKKYTLKFILALLFLICISAQDMAFAREMPSTSFREPLQNGPIDCNQTPFGASIVAIPEHEVMIYGHQGAGTYYTSSGLAFGEPAADNHGTVAAHNTLGAIRDATAADMNGDGYEESIVAGFGSSQEIVVVAHGRTASDSNITQRDDWQSGVTISQDVRIAAGQLRAGSADWLAVALMDQNGVVKINLIGAIGGNLFTEDSTYYGSWNGVSVGYRELYDVAVDDVNGDGTDEVIFAYFDETANEVNVHVFQYDTASPDSDAFQMRELYHWTEEAVISTDIITTAFEVQLETGNVNGDRRAEMMVIVNGANVNGAQQLSMFGFSAVDPFTPLQFTERFSLHSDYNQVGAYDFAVGNLDTDPFDEFGIFSVRTRVNTNPIVHRQIFDWNSIYKRLDANTESIVETTEDVSNVNVTIADMNGNGIGELIVSRTLGTGSFVAQYEKSTDATASEELPAIGIAVGIGLMVAADYDGNSVRATIGTDCRRVTEPNVKSVMWMPPHWEHIQGTAENADEMFTGFSASGTTTNTSESGFSTSTSHDISGSLGAKAGFDVFGIGASAELRATAGANFENSRGSTTGNEKSYSIEEGSKSNLNNGLLIAEDSTYDCYQYTLTGPSVTEDSHVRLCEFISTVNDSESIFGWESDKVDEDLEKLPQWSTVQRSWANLALFNNTVEVKAAVNGTESNANDGNLHNLIGAQSAAGTQEPYWQIDLDESQPITTVRLWANDSCCQMRDVYLFVSNQSFAANDTIQGLMADSNVASYYHAGYARQSLSFDTRHKNTKAGIAGRYVRVMLADTNRLSLDEVQIFGETHVEPAHYPRAINANSSNGGFEVEMYNPLTQMFEWIPIDGELIWDGTGETGVGYNNVIRGTASDEWHMTESTSKFSTNTTSATNSIRAGAAFEGEIGTVVGGLAYEFEKGITRENSNSISWTEEMQIGGAVVGFPDGSNEFNDCAYFMQPYSYITSEKANSGFSHQFMVVDYIVRDVDDGGDTIDRADIPEKCFNPNDADNDGVPDEADAFPNDPNEQYDSDGDGLGDNEDASPYVSAPVNVSLSVSTGSASEAGATVITVMATVDQPVATTQTVSLGVSGTNITTGDYALSGSTITIAAGQTQGSVTFTVIDDAVVESAETATLTISSPSSGLLLGSPTTATITIQDNDTTTPTSFTVFLPILVR